MITKTYCSVLPSPLCVNFSDLWPRALTLTVVTTCHCPFSSCFPWLFRPIPSAKTWTVDGTVAAQANVSLCRPFLDSHRRGVFSLPVCQGIGPSPVPKRSIPYHQKETVQLEHGSNMTLEHMSFGIMQSMGTYIPSDHSTNGPNSKLLLSVRSQPLVPGSRTTSHEAAKTF